jgi:type IV pilus assembly protein PilB
MGIEPFLITSALKLVISQRLIKKMCPKCGKTYKITEKLLTNKIDTFLE